MVKLRLSPGLATGESALHLKGSIHLIFTVSAESMRNCLLA